MPIRRMRDASDVETMMDIVKQHDKIQGIPKSAVYMDINDPMYNYDNLISQYMIKTISDEENYYLGNFSDSNELLCFMRFNIWTDPDIDKKSWTWGSIFRNKNVALSYSYNQKYYPDEIINLHNHAVSIVENQDITIGYSVLYNAIPDNRIKLADITATNDSGESVLLCDNNRYTSELVEKISGGTNSQFFKYYWNVSRARISINHCIYRYTKIE